MVVVAALRGAEAAGSLGQVLERGLVAARSGQPLSVYQPACSNTGRGGRRERESEKRERGRDL